VREQELKGVPGAWRLFAVSVDSSDERTQVEPAHDYMTGADRLTVRLARRAPGAMQTLGRLTQRGARSAETHSGYRPNRRAVLIEAPALAHQTPRCWVRRRASV
jgi:hypothetical protein